jgi:hypothetical protein
MTRLVFMSAIRAGGEIKNLSFALVARHGWTGINPLDGRGYPYHRDLAEKAAREINALLHAGFPLEALAAAARLSHSNHAEIVRDAAAAAARANHSLASFNDQQRVQA